MKKAGNAGLLHSWWGRSVDRQLHIGEQLVQLQLVAALHRPGLDLAGQVGRKGLDEVAHEAAQEGTAAEADAGHTGLEQIAGIQGDQVVVLLIHRRSEEHTSELQSREKLVCRLL